MANPRQDGGIVEPARRHRVPIRRVSPEERRTSFDEVDCPYTRDEATAEARRCVLCARPYCEEACPAGNPIRTWIAQLAVGDVEGAYRSISTASSLPAVCGRVCPVERQCEGACVLGLKAEPIAIGMLERFVADEMIDRRLPATRALPTGRRVAVVGSGPAGLTAAGDLALLGHRVSVLEALPVLGGVLAWGIPPFVLPSRPLEAELERLRWLGVQLRTGTRVGHDLSLEDLFTLGFEAIVIAVGAPRPLRLGIPGERLAGVYSATDYLMSATGGRARPGGPRTLPPRGARLAVVGGGDTAVDVARVAVRLGASEIRILYRRAVEHLPARREGVALAREEGVLIDERTAACAIVDAGTGRVAAVDCAHTSLDGPEEGRRGPVLVAADRTRRPFDAVVVAIGYRPDRWLSRARLPLRPDGTVVTDAEGRTRRPGVFAAGDVANGPDLVVTAMAAGRRAAVAVNAYLIERAPTGAPAT